MCAFFVAVFAANLFAFVALAGHFFVADGFAFYGFVALGAVDLEFVRLALALLGHFDSASVLAVVGLVRAFFDF